MRFDSRRINGKVADAWLSSEVEDSAWDDFLEASPLGHFQQSSLWSRAKSVEGWRPIRMVVTLDDRIVGGYQILTRNTRFGAVGYIYKGLVVTGDEKALSDFVVSLVVSVTKVHRLRALILQPPDQSAIDVPSLARHGFLPNHLFNVISATLVVNTACSMDEIMSRMRKTTGVELKQAHKRGIEIREGDEGDIGTFFRLMTNSCKRQQTSPAPATESAMMEIWKAFHPAGLIRLTLAEFQGEPVAGALCLCFGERVTFWKKGWSGAHRERHPNQMVMFDAIRWAHQRGYKLFDCAAMNRDTAVSVLEGTPLSEHSNEGQGFLPPWLWRRAGVAAGIANLHQQPPVPLRVPISRSFRLVWNSGQTAGELEAEILIAAMGRGFVRVNPPRARPDYWQVNRSPASTVSRPQCA